MTFEQMEAFKNVMGEVHGTTRLNVEHIDKLEKEIHTQIESIADIAHAIEQISNEARSIEEKTMRTNEISNGISKALVDNLSAVEQTIDKSKKLKDDMNFFKI